MAPARHLPGTTSPYGPSISRPSSPLLVASASPPVFARSITSVLTRPPSPRGSVPISTRRPSITAEKFSLPAPASNPEFAMVEEDLSAISQLRIPGLARARPESPKLEVCDRRRAFTDDLLYQKASASSFRRAGLISPSSDSGPVLSSEGSKLTVVGKDICVQGTDGRRIVIFQGGFDSDKQVKMLQQICSAVRSLAPEAWNDDDGSPVSSQPAISNCCICMEDHTTAAGVECEKGGHFVCDDCFAHYVKTQCSLDVNSASAEDGSLYCPGRCSQATSSGSTENARCTATYDSQVVAKHTPSEVFESYWGFRNRLAEQRIAAEMEAALKARAEAEQRHNEAARARNELADLLTLKCPKCGQAFTDFLGCFALQCSRHTCRASFCGWCLQDCGKDPGLCHQHVVACKIGRERCPADPTFGTGEAMARTLFEANCQDRRQTIMREYLAKLEPKLRSQVLELAKTELAALGLDNSRQAASSSSGAPAAVQNGRAPQSAAAPRPAAPHMPHAASNRVTAQNNLHVADKTGVNGAAAARNLGIPRHGAVNPGVSSHFQGGGSTSVPRTVGAAIWPNGTGAPGAIPPSVGAPLAAHQPAALGTGRRLVR